MEIMYYDLETTGLSPNQHGIIQFAGLLEIYGELKMELSYHVKPYPDDLLDGQALAVTGTTTEMMAGYDDPTDALNWIIERTSAHLSGRRDDKIWLCGYNNAAFDDHFMRAWFLKAGKDKWAFGNLFWNESLDMRIICGAALKSDRPKMPNFKLKTVCEHLGVTVDDTQTHKAMYDAELVRALSRKVKVSTR